MMFFCKKYQKLFLTTIIVNYNQQLLTIILLKQEYGAEREFRWTLTLQFRGRAFGATGRCAGDFFWGNKNTPSLMATKIIKNLEKLFCFCL